MKALAAANIRQCEDAVDALQGYYEAVELGFQAVLRRRTDVLPRPPEWPDGPSAALVFGSGQGLCGRFNEGMAAFAAARLAEGSVPLVAAVGRRVVPALEEEGVGVERSFEMPSSIAGITDAVRTVLEAIDAWQAAGRAASVRLYHQRPVAGAAVEPRSLRLTPLDPDWFAYLERRPWPTNQLAATFSGDAVVLRALVRQYLFASLFRAFAESMAGEHASRLRSMQAAERSIEARVDGLTGHLRRERQRQITEEVLDIASGYRSVVGPGP